MLRPGGHTETIRRSEHTTTDPEEARDLINSVYGPRTRVDALGGDGLRLGLDATEVAGVSLSRIRLQAELEFRVDDAGHVLIGAVIAGRGSYSRGAHVARHGPGDVFLGHRTRTAWSCRLDGMRLEVVALPEALLAEVSGAGPGRRPRLRPSGAPPASTNLWRTTIGYVRELLDGLGEASAPLVVGPALRLLAATALAVFPAEATADPGPERVRDAHPDTLRRAIAYIESYLDRDVTLADIATAAYVTPRALQIAFRRHLGTTPMAYLRRVRLDRARIDLLAGDGRNVTTIAFRWGFGNLSRFSALYHAAYGEMPSRTLRTAAPKR